MDFETAGEISTRRFSHPSLSTGKNTLRKTDARRRIQIMRMGASNKSRGKKLAYDYKRIGTISNVILCADIFAKSVWVGESREGNHF